MAKERKNGTFNKVNVFGKLKDNNVEVKANNNGVEYLTGNLTLQFGDNDNDVIKFEVYQPSQSNEGKTNKAFENNLRLLENAVTMAKATEDNPATVLGAGGNFPFAPTISTEPYYSAKKGEYGSSFKANLGYGTRLKDGNEDDLGATFQLEGAVISPPYFEEVNGEDVMKVQLLTTIYSNGSYVPTINEVTVRNETYFTALEDIYVPENTLVDTPLGEDFNFVDNPDSQELQDFIDDCIIKIKDLNETGIDFTQLTNSPFANFSGVPSLASINESVVKEVAIGEDIEETVRKFYAELTVTGVMQCEDLDADDFIESLENYLEFLETMKQEAEEKANKKQKTTTSSARRGGGRTSSDSSSRRTRRTRR